MPLLSVDQITKAYEPVVVLDAISFQVRAGERIGLGGANGSGKSTLLKIVAGEFKPTPAG